MPFLSRLFFAAASMRSIFLSSLFTRLRRSACLLCDRARAFFGSPMVSCSMRLPLAPATGVAVATGRARAGAAIPRGRV